MNLKALLKHLYDNVVNKFDSHMHIIFHQYCNNVKPIGVGRGGDVCVWGGGGGGDLAHLNNVSGGTNIPFAHSPHAPSRNTHLSLIAM